MQTQKIIIIRRTCTQQTH